MSPYWLYKFYSFGKKIIQIWSLHQSRVAEDEEIGIKIFACSKQVGCRGINFIYIIVLHIKDESYWFAMSYYRRYYITWKIPYTTVCLIRSMRQNVLPYGHVEWITSRGSHFANNYFRVTHFSREVWNLRPKTFTFIEQSVAFIVTVFSIHKLDIVQTQQRVCTFYNII